MIWRRNSIGFDKEAGGSKAGPSLAIKNPPLAELPSSLLRVKVHLASSPARLAIETLYHWIEDTLPRIRRNRPLGFGVALAIFLLALGIRFAVEPYAASPLPFLTFFVPVILATLVGGVGAGLITVGLSLFAAWYFFIPPRNSFLVDPTSIIPILAYAAQALFLVFIGFLLNTLVERLTFERRRAEEHLRESADSERTMANLNQELRHRLKNLFAVIISLLRQTSRHIPESAQLVRSVSGRLSAMGEGQDLLAANRFEGIEFSALCRKTLAPLAPVGANRLLLSGPPTWLNGDAVTPLVLLFHELGTNALKHGAWSAPTGSVHVSWSYKADDSEAHGLELDWQEQGGPPVETPQRTGFGTTLIARVLADGEVVIDYKPDGLRCHASLPVGCTETAPSDR